MIRGPVFPQMRDSLWNLVSSRLDSIESGLKLVLESLDCSDGELGPVDGLARDATGGAVLVMLAVDGDALLAARALSAGRFLGRVGDALAQAIPEANFCQGVPGRILVIGSESSSSAITEVCALPIHGLHACTLEPFRIAGRERFAVRWMPVAAERVAGAPAAGVDVPSDAQPAALPTQPVSSQPEFIVPPARAGLWEATLSVCERIDHAVMVRGDRYSRSISWNGNVLGDVRTVGGALVASAATGVVRELRDLRDVRRFGDQLLRAFVRSAELDLGKGRDAEARDTEQSSHSGRNGASAATNGRSAAARHAAGDRREAPAGESLRSSLAEAKLTPEEYSALGEPASVAGTITGASLAKDRS